MLIPFSLIIALIPSLGTTTGRVIDIRDEFPISGAMVFTSSDTTYTDINGFFKLPYNGADSITIKAMSYADMLVCTSDCDDDIKMSVAKPKNVLIRSGKGM